MEDLILRESWEFIRFILSLQVLTCTVQAGFFRELLDGFDFYVFWISQDNFYFLNYFWTQDVRIVDLMYLLQLSCSPVTDFFII